MAGCFLTHAKRYPHCMKCLIETIIMTLSRFSTFSFESWQKIKAFYEGSSIKQSKFCNTAIVYLYFVVNVTPAVIKNEIKIFEIHFNFAEIRIKIKIFVSQYHL